MFKSLQARLLLSYLLIIIVCLALVGLTALVLLRGYQKTMTYSRLTDRATLAAGLIGQMLHRGMPPQDAVRRLDGQLNGGKGKETWIALLDGTGRLAAGNDNRLRDQQFGTATAQTERGEHRLAGGERLLYVTVPVRSLRDPAAAPWTLILAEPLRPTRQALDSLLPRLLWAGLIALAVSVVVAAVVAYSIARPLDRIAQAAEEVAAGDYDQSLQIEAPTEVARLARSFNSMARQVQATLRSQQDLVANVSHELKTPLTSIQGFSQALLDGTAEDGESRRRAAAIIHEEAGRMRRLVDELLDLARLEAGQVELAQATVDVGALLR
ncbi:MAG TPA: HAMP domain-containing protein, partial [Anaerolineae bacterium]|nr:HAMP domain-containing protein [Anaerolineae bacterium]